MRAVAPALIALVLLAGCGRGSDDVGGVSPDEDRQLNEAASALDANFMAAPDNAVDANANATAPADQGNSQ